MKRLSVALVFALLPVALVAQAPDRDVLLTSDGTLYTIESVENEGSAPTGVSRYLQLTIQRPNEPSQTTRVPESLAPGFHSYPALAYDNDSQTLFVFWLKMPNAMSSELLLASYSNGRWRPALSIDNKTYDLRSNLRIGITRRVAQLQNDGSYIDVPALLVHAIWWDETGYAAKARYALIVIDKGVVTTLELHDLGEFTTSPGILPSPVDANFNAEILKHPAFIDNGTRDSIDVIFGDIDYNVFNTVRLKPIADGRIHIPIGAHPGGPRIPAPKSFSADWSGPISAIPSPHDGSLLLYNTGKDTVNYIMYSNGAWSSVKTLPLSAKLSADAAAAALVRMMHQ